MQVWAGQQSILHSRGGLLQKEKARDDGHQLNLILHNFKFRNPNLRTSRSAKGKKKAKAKAKAKSKAKATVGKCGYPEVFQINKLNNKCVVVANQIKLMSRWAQG